MGTVRILLEVHSTDERTSQELADIAAGRLTSCLGVDQSVQEPVSSKVLDEYYEYEIRQEGYTAGWKEYELSEGDM